MNPYRTPATLPVEPPPPRPRLWTKILFALIGAVLGILFALIGAVLGILFALVGVVLGAIAAAGCIPREAKSELADSTYLADEMRCVDEHDTREEIDECRKAARARWGIAETVRDAGGDQ